MYKEPEESKVVPPLDVTELLACLVRQSEPFLDQLGVRRNVCEKIVESLCSKSKNQLLHPLSSGESSVLDSENINDELDVRIASVLQSTGHSYDGGFWTDHAKNDPSDQKRHVAIVTTASLPWMTGTAVNPLFRAAYLAESAKQNVTLLVPWLCKSDQELVYPSDVTFTSPEEQETYIRNWLEERVGFKADFKISFYPGKFSKERRSIIPAGDTCQFIPSKDADIAILEEPEHLNWYHHGKRWTDKFNHVVGVVHTNYLEYIKREKNGALQAFFVKHINNWVTRAYCDKVLRLSAATQDLPRSVICNVHGVNPKFLRIGEKVAVEKELGQETFSKGAYFLGKMVWAKGYRELIDLLAKHKNDLDGFKLDVYGNGEDANEVQSTAKSLDLNLNFLKGRDHADDSLHGYKVFINPSVSDVLCTATAEALAMGKFVVCANHPSNEFFRSFPNCLTYETPEDFVVKVKEAMESDPQPLTPEQRYNLSWEAATQRFMEYSDLDKVLNKDNNGAKSSIGNGKKISKSASLSSLTGMVDGGLAFAHYCLTGNEFLRLCTGAIPGTRDYDKQHCKDLHLLPPHVENPIYGWYKMDYGFELCFPESEVYSARVNNLCAASTVLSNFTLQFNDEHTRRFRRSCFGHLMDLDKIQFSGQMVHGLALRRVAGLGVKDMHGLSYAIGSKVVQFTAKDFCLISGLKFGVEPSISSADDGVHKLLNDHFTNKNHVTLHDIEKAFLNSKKGSEDCFKLGMLNFVEFVILGKSPNVRINEDYLHLVHNMEEFNNFPWGSMSFEHLQDSLLFAPGKKDNDEKDDEKGKRQRKGKEEVKRSVKRGKKKVEEEKRIRINRPAWSIKGFSFALQIWAYELIPELEMAPLRYCKRKDEVELVPRICRWESTDKTPEFRKLNMYIFQSKQPLLLRHIRPSALEMQQNYWSWGSEFPESDAPNIGPRVCTDLTEVNYVVQQLRDEIALLHREKGEQCENFLHFKNSTTHEMEVMRLELLALRKIIGDGGGNVVVPSIVKVKRVEKEEGVGGEEAHQPEDAVQNEKGEVEYIPPEINWDDNALVCLTLVNFLQNHCRKKKLSIEEDEGDDDKNDVAEVVTEVHKKRGRGRHTTVQPAMKKPRSVRRETPWQGEEVPNIGEDRVGLSFEPLRPVPHDSLLKMGKFLWEWGQEENSHVRLCGEHGVDVSHDFFVRLLSKDGWLDDMNIDMGLYLVRERQMRYPNLVGSHWTIVDTLFQKYAAIDFNHMRLYGGKEDRPHSKALVNMVKGELHQWGKPWTSVKQVFLPYNMKRQKHWVAVVLDLTICQILVYDSKIDLCRTQTLVKALQPLAKLIPMLLKEAGYVSDCPLLTTEWPVHRVLDAPQQVGGGDCGMYVIKYCEFLSSNVDLGKICDEAMHLFRLKLGIDLLQGCCSI